MKKFATTIITAAMVLATSITPMAATVDSVHPTDNAMGICENCNCYRPLVEVTTETTLVSAPICGISCGGKDAHREELMPYITYNVICTTTLCETCANLK